jgi:hypothetical protein
VKLKGVCYDVGVVYGMNWRPDFRTEIVRHELEIIRRDLHCNAVRILGKDPRRLVVAGRAALAEGLETWIFPQCWDRSPTTSASYLARAAREIEPLRKEGPDQVVLGVAMEATLFNEGIIPGRSMTARVRSPQFFPTVRSGTHNRPLNVLLTRLRKAVQREYHGRLTYASLVWEGIDWSSFDFVGVDHYFTTRIADRWTEMLRPAIATGKPVVITEFGFSTADDGPGADAFLDSAGLKPSLIDIRYQFLHQLPVIGRFVRARLKKPLVRDEKSQAQKLVAQLDLIERAGVLGGFVSTFQSQITPYDEEPRFDVDTASPSLVRYLDRGHGATYPDMPWEPKESFRAVADYYAKH